MGNVAGGIEPQEILPQENRKTALNARVGNDFILQDYTMVPLPNSDIPGKKVYRLQDQHTGYYAINPRNNSTYFNLNELMPMYIKGRNNVQLQGPNVLRTPAPSVLIMDNNSTE